MKIDTSYSYTDIDNFRFEPLAVVKARLSELNRLIAKQNLFIVLTKNGKPQTALVKFDFLKKLLRQYEAKKLYIDPSKLKRKKRDPAKEKWLKKWNQLGFYEKG